MAAPINLERILSMKGGKGEASYLNNSQAQAQHARSMLHLLVETLNGVRLDMSPELPFVVADLGCSCGANTLQTMEIIINHITKCYEVAGIDPPEFSAFFSDLPSNDFNTLFQILPSYAGGALTMESHRSYFAAAVPGSFYLRLFPAKSVDFFYSAFSLHWLSQVPELVLDKKSRAYNKGKVFIHEAKDDAANSYKKQFQNDLSGFLRYRSKELKNGGSMFLVCLGRSHSDPIHQGGPGLLFGTHFQDAWEDLVQEGLVTREERDNFNIPIYAPSLEEVREVVEADGSFIINKLQLFKGGSPLIVSNPEDKNEIGHVFANTCRSVSGVLVDAHIGHPLSDELFSRVESRATAHAKEIFEQLQFVHMVASLSLPNV